MQGGFFNCWVFAFGAWTLKGWGWTLGIAVGVLVIVWNLIGLVPMGAGGIVGAIVGIVIAGVIIWYLMCPDVQQAFGRA